jgi:hypothetical protein
MSGQQPRNVATAVAEETSVFGTAVRDALASRLPARLPLDPNPLLNRVPDLALQRCYLELRLQDASGELDLGLGFTKRGPITNGAGCAALAARLAAEQEWRDVARYLAEWSAAPPLHPIQRIWLGLDGHSATGALAGVIYLDQGARVPGSVTRDMESRAARKTLAQIAPNRDGTSAAETALLERLIQSAPPAARPQLIGAHVGRGNRALKLCLAYLTNADIAAYLDRVGWSGHAGDLLALVSAAPWPERYHAGPGLFHLLVSDRLAPRIDLEYKCHDADQETAGLRERPLIERLVELGLCSETAAEAVLAWPGVEPVRTTSWQLIRTVNSIKLVFDESGPSVKAYLNCAFVPAV